MFWKLSSFQRHTANQYLLTYELPRARFWGPLRRPMAPYSCLTDCFIFQHSDRHQCASCNTHLTVRHLLLHCGELNSQRQPLIAYCRIQNIGIGTVASLEHANLPHLLFDFLRKTGLTTRLQKTIVCKSFNEIDWTTRNGPNGPKCQNKQTETEKQHLCDSNDM